MRRGLVDTSAFVSAVEGEIEAAALPEESMISIVTVCELNHGVLAASERKRPLRLRALNFAQHEFEALPIDYLVAVHYGELKSNARRRHKARPDPADTLIAATAMAHGLPVITQDKGFKVFDGVEVVFV
jgi:predicted nucleic acid-binding protein